MAKDIIASLTAQIKNIGDSVLNDLEKAAQQSKADRDIQAFEEIYSLAVKLKITEQSALDRLIEGIVKKYDSEQADYVKQKRISQAAELAERLSA